MQTTQKPNIIFILIDDMGWKDLGCYGSTFYETPNIDRLAKEGMLFTDAYAACPVCSPTRASIMSGKYPATVGVTDWIDHGNYHPCKGKLIDAPYIKHLPLSEKSVAAALKEGGYQTWHIGKWHLGEKAYYPENHGFDVNIGGCHWGHPKNGYFSPYKIETMEDGPIGEYLTDRLTDEAIKLIQENDSTPYFLNLWHYTVHTPIQAKDEDTKKYEAKKTKMGLNDIEEFEEGEFFPCEHNKHLKVKRRLVQGDTTYAAMIENLDYNIGRLLDAVKQSGQEDNTIVIFTSDNGGLSTAEGSPTCNSPLNEGKGWMYEGGVREPLIVKWPKAIKPNTVSHIPVTSPDFYPTFLEAAGLDSLPEQHTDGVSIMPILKGEEDKFRRESIYWHYPHYGNQGGTPGSSMRMGDYKLIEFFEDGRLELYNLKDDIEEKSDISSNEPQLVSKMHEMLIAWRESIDAKIPVVNSEFR